MLYVIGLTESFENAKEYVIFETSTESVLNISTDIMKKLITVHNIHIKNINLIQNELALKTWCHALNFSRAEDADVIESGANFVLICKSDNTTFKLASSIGGAWSASSKQLTKEIRKNNVANCKVVNRQYKSMDTYNITKDIQFEAEIAEKYARYVAMTAVLGCQMSFQYIIENKEVKLKKYTGTSKYVIVPKFITSIMIFAFHGSQIQTIKLERGLKSIGSYAFGDCNLQEVTIPDTVIFMGNGIFHANKQLIEPTGKYKESIRILNEKTAVMDNYIDAS